MKKLSKLFKGTSGRVILIISVILIAFFGSRSYMRAQELERLKKFLIGNNNWDQGLSDGKTWDRLAKALYKLKKQNGELKAWWA